MLYGNTVTIQMTQTRHVTHRRAASLLLAALDEPDFSSRTTNPHQSTTSRRRRDTRPDPSQKAPGLPVRIAGENPSSSG